MSKCKMSTFMYNALTIKIITRARDENICFAFTFAIDVQF